MIYDFHYDIHLMQIAHKHCQSSKDFSLDFFKYVTIQDGQLIITNGKYLLVYTLRNEEFEPGSYSVVKINSKHYQLQSTVEKIQAPNLLKVISDSPRSLDVKTQGHEAIDDLIGSITQKYGVILPWDICTMFKDFILGSSHVESGNISEVTKNQVIFNGSNYKLIIMPRWKDV